MAEEILDDVFAEGSETQLVEASKEKRLGNYIIDYIACMILIFSVTFVFAMVGIIDPYSNNPLFDNLFGILLYFAYYVIAEAAMGGKTIGKHITKTRVVTNNGQKPEFGTILGRTLSRLIPFEAFSYLGKKPNGWHDRLSGTIVIDERQSVLVDEGDFV